MTIEPGSVCLKWDCTSPDAPAEVVWKCPGGHRKSYRYCAGHAGEMTELATAAGDAAGTAFLLSPVCKECGMVMSPVLEHTAC